MQRVFVTVRGHMESPSLLELDLEQQKIVAVHPMPMPHLEHIPPTKIGLAGIHHHKGTLYTATWDRIFAFDLATNQVRNVITDRHFTDLHGLFVDEKDLLWVTSTNLDGVYTVADERDVKPFWHAWKALNKTDNLALEEKDYRSLTKTESGFHRYHLNSVIATERHVFVSFLGTFADHTPWEKRLIKLKLQQQLQRDGGIFVLDRKTAQLQKTFRTEGLHDPAIGNDGFLYYSEYFGDGLLRLDTQRLKVTRIRLEAPSWQEWGYLTRGVLADGDFLWVGYTQHRKWSKEGWDKNSVAYLRKYDKSGKWQGTQIELPGFVGIYAIVAV